MTTQLRIATAVFLVVATLATLFIRVPLPTGGYFNFGDVVVVFGGLTLGHMAKRAVWLPSAIAGGIGSAIADIVGGYALFSPITLVAKGLEGALAGLAAKQISPLLLFGLLIIGGLLMVAGYFVGETLLPSIGIAGAITELIPNFVQAGGGIIGGYILFQVFKQITVLNAEVE